MVVIISITTKSLHTIRTLNMSLLRTTKTFENWVSPDVEKVESASDHFTCLRENLKQLIHCCGSQSAVSLIHSLVRLSYGNTKRLLVKHKHLNLTMRLWCYRIKLYRMSVEIILWCTRPREEVSFPILDPIVFIFGFVS